MNSVPAANTTTADGGGSVPFVDTSNATAIQVSETFDCYVELYENKLPCETSEFCYAQTFTCTTAGSDRSGCSGPYEDKYITGHNESFVCLNNVALETGGDPGAPGGTSDDTCGFYTDPQSEDEKTKKSEWVTACMSAGSAVSHPITLPRFYAVLLRCVHFFCVLSSQPTLAHSASEALTRNYPQGRAQHVRLRHCG